MSSVLRVLRNPVFRGLAVKVGTAMLGAVSAKIAADIYDNVKNRKQTPALEEETR